MDKYKDPYEVYYNPYSAYAKNKESDGYGTYGYNKNGYNQNGYNQNGYRQNRYEQNRYDQDRFDPSMFMNKEMQVPIQMPEQDYNGMDEMDKKKIKALYPEVCRKIQYYIEEECDKMDYSGSYMYDEYPEKEMIEMVTDKIYEKVEKDDTIDIKEFEEKIEPKEFDDDNVDASGKRFGYYRRPNRWLRNNIQVMFINEMFGRRCRRTRRSSRPRQRRYSPQPYYYRYPDFFE